MGARTSPMSFAPMVAGQSVEGPLFRTPSRNSDTELASSADTDEVETAPETTAAITDPPQRRSLAPVLELRGPRESSIPRQCDAAEFPSRRRSWTSRWMAKPNRSRLALAAHHSRSVVRPRTRRISSEPAPRGKARGRNIQSLGSPRRSTSSAPPEAAPSSTCRT
jgi:hypothetical protein